MYAKPYVYMSLPVSMTGKLYWRLKKNGKWTWKRAELGIYSFRCDCGQPHHIHPSDCECHVCQLPDGDFL